MHSTRIGFVLAMSLAVVSTSYGQLERSWYRNFADHSEFTKTKHLAATDSRGNCYVVSQSARAIGDKDVQIRKIGSDGAQIWERWVAGTAGIDDACYAIVIDRSDNLIVAGFVENSATGKDAFVSKYSPLGEVIYSNQIDGGHGYGDMWTGLLLSPSGTLFLIGFQRETSSVEGPSTQVIQALNAAGTVLWTKRNTRLTSSQASSGIMTFRPAITYAGEVASSKITKKKKLPIRSKFNESPASLVVFRFSGTGRGELFATIYDPANGREFSTRKYPSYIFGPSDFHYVLPDLQPWVAELGVIDSMQVLHSSSSGELTIFGDCSYLGSRRSYVLRIDSQLIPVWASRFDPTSGLDCWVRSNGAYVDRNGNCYMGGSTGASARTPRGYVARFSNSGHLDWQFSDRRIAWLEGGLAVDSRGTIYASGRDETLSESQSRLCVMSFDPATGASRVIDTLDASSYRSEGGYLFASHNTRPNDMAMSPDGTLFVAGEFGAPRFSASLLVAYRIRP